MNARQAIFVQEYLKDMNATQAAIRAGYSPKTAKAIGSENLTKPYIVEAINTALALRAKKAQVTQDDVLRELKSIAFASMADVAEWNEHGVRFKSSSELSEDAKRSVQQVEQVMNEHGGTLKIKQYDKMQALKLFGQHLGMFVDKLDLNHTVEVRQHKNVPDEELESDLE